MTNGIFDAHTVSVRVCALSAPMHGAVWAAHLVDVLTHYQTPGTGFDVVSKCSLEQSRV